MALGLGIDTGGTYTDGVLFDFEENRVLAREKRRTTPHDLSEGIGNLLGALDAEALSRVRLVSLSTTLATNACVEGRGCRAALILMGYNPVLVERLKAEYGLTNAEELHVIAGAHTQRGDEAAPPDWDALDALCEGLRGRVDAVGVAEYWGVRNPEYEIRAKARVREKTGLPVAAAHELSAEINSMRRAATTLLNARLIPLIDELLEAVDASLAAHGVNAPLMVVRGDGSLMTEAFARECPVETMLSGPAASVTGAMRLSGARDLLAVDVGGTTTDLAVVRNGFTDLAEDGVNVGAWRTGTRAIAIRTIGLGGDTGILWDVNAGLRLGEARALPLCELAARHPEAKKALEDWLSDDKPVTYARGVFFIRNRRVPATLSLTDGERALLDALSDGPKHIDALADILRTRPYFIKPGRLEEMGFVLRAMLTPTDLMHLSGDFSAFDREASELGARLLAAQAGMNADDLIGRCWDMIGERLYRLLANFLLARSAGRPVSEPDTLRLGYAPRGDELEVCLRSSLPVVGIGAPARRMIERAAERLSAPLMLPEDYAVANAVGAITGSVLVEERVEIKPHYDALGISGYSAHASAGIYRAEKIEDCEAWARETAREAALERALRMGADNPAVELATEDSGGVAAGVQKGAFLLARFVIARAYGRVAIR